MLTAVSEPCTQWRRCDSSNEGGVFSQGLGLRFHYRLANALTPVLPLESGGSTCATRSFIKRLSAKHRHSLPNRTSSPVGDPSRSTLSVGQRRAWLRRREHEMEVGPLWDALVCDRRMMQGRWCKERQDYRPRFTHEEFLRILTVALRRVETWFDPVARGIYSSGSCP